MAIILVGDIHGSINDMYSQISKVESSSGIVNPILQVGDFQAIRDEKDLARMCVPAKYKTLGDFPEYLRKGYVLRPTYFIGGNHENDFWHKEHPEGKQLVTNLYYLGRSGIFNLDNLTIGWVSGNFSKVSFNEVIGDKKNKKYHHFTKSDIAKLLEYPSQIDLLILHEWPSIEQLQKHTKIKNISNEGIFESELKRNRGNLEHYKLVKALKPKLVIAGHSHIHLEFDSYFDDLKFHFLGLSKFNYPHSLYSLESTNLNLNSLN